MGKNEEVPSTLGARIDIINNIEDSISLGGDLTTIAYTDDLTDEEIILKTSREKYGSIFNTFRVKFSATNASLNDQTVALTFAFDEGLEVASVRRFMGNTTTTIASYVIPATATSSEIIVPPEDILEPTWSNIPVQSFTLGTQQRKFTDGKTPNQAILVPLTSGETAYFEAIINYTSDLGEGSEFFIEAFGDKGSYGHLR